MRAMRVFTSFRVVRPVHILGTSEVKDKTRERAEAVTIEETFARRGRGVFVIGNFEKGHNIIAERPIITCSHWRQSNGVKTVAEEWCALPIEDQIELRTRFRKKLRYVPVGRSSLGPIYRMILEKFILEYGFCNPQRSLAHIYVLGSHMNHACMSCANAQQWTESDAPHRIIVRLVKPLKAGDEVFINYNRRQGPTLQCPLCGYPPSMADRFKSLCNGAFRWLRGFTSNNEASSTTTVNSTPQADAQNTRFNPSPRRGAKLLRDKF
ncbi:hypothetical protein Trco_005589, partial [Trichoderma cornu-damae]